MVNGENPPVRLILCAEKDHAVARYPLDGLPNKVMAAKYRTALPAEATLAGALHDNNADLFALVLLTGDRRDHSLDCSTRSSAPAG